jgi:hypothetical protein
MALFGRFWPVFFIVANLMHVSASIVDTPCPVDNLDESDQPDMAEIIYATLMKYPNILEAVFQKNPHILWNAQQRMIQEFSTQVGESAYHQTLKTLDNTPDLWNQMQQAPLIQGRKKIIAFLDPLCLHSAMLLKNMLKIAQSSKGQISFCPHWVTNAGDKKGQIVVRALLAANALGKISSFLESLIDCIQNAQIVNVLRLAAQLGIHMPSFQTHMFSEDTEKSISDARTHFNQFQFQGFPIILYKKDNLNHPDNQKKPIEIIEGNPHDLEELAELLSH